MKEDRATGNYEINGDLQGKILSSIKEAIIVMDEKDTIISCNEAFIKLFGWDKDECIGKYFFDFAKDYIEDESKEKLFWSGEEMKDEDKDLEEKHYDEIICYTKEGNMIVTDINKAVLRDYKGEFKGIVLSIRDVTERFECQLELKRSEEKYHYLYNSIDEGFAIVDVLFDTENNPVDFRFVELNPAYEKQTGISNKDIIGKTAKESNLQVENFWMEIYGDVALTGEPVRFVNRSKILNMWLDVYVFKINLDKSNRLGVSFKDITERVAYNKRLEKLLKMQDELYLNVSHELKTPLNVIFSANQMSSLYLENDKIEENKDKLISYNNKIKQNCYRLIKLVDNIMDLSKSNSGLLNLYNVNIVEVVENIVLSISGYIKSKELNIVFDTNVEEKIMTCDPDKIERIILNLISNAIKFSNPQGTIYVNLVCQEDKVVISVKDTGVGIKKENLDNIFNRFFQEDKSLSRNAEGTGIGLSIIKSLVELHDGNITVESELNKGTTFKVELPARKLELEQVAEEPNPYSHSCSDKIEKIKIEFSDIYSV